MLVSGKTDNDVMKNTEITIKKHVEFKDRGDVDWTKSQPPQERLKVNDTICKFVNNIKKP